MNSQQLLFNLAREYSREKRSFSKEEIQSKINEIKYLSAQKKVPRMTLRKEILHLENKLKSIFELEQKLSLRERKESLKITSLKKHIASLQQRLASCEEKDLHKKVDRLSYLLAEHHAKRKIAHDVAVHTKKWAKPKKQPHKSAVNMADLSQRLQQAKEKLQSMPGNEELQQKILLLERKLAEFNKPSIELKNSEPALEQNPPKIKHTLKFDSPFMVDKSDIASEKELPLPPPPRMRKK